ncbi:hypothetical protein BQ8482_10020 [Mesorhizobium delmotii]|uniref:Uncharacterized protein n=1 Tax=Mesorhizobium delmotii TaxID=1631247 RepID=A0A2P9A9K4_9HYPH|nr:hypothetical protein BQ8482_10020 [Mesorhizobium delmotii]
MSQYPVEASEQAEPAFADFQNSPQMSIAAPEYGRHNRLLPIGRLERANPGANHPS